MTTGIKLPKPRFLSTLSLRRATNPLWLMGYDVGFLSTLSLRRATYRSIDRNNVGKISIHALLAESDSMYTSLCCGCFDFYPRSPCGERHPKTSNHPHSTNFYPRSPCGERPSYSQHVTRPSGYFYPRSPCGERRREGPHCQGLS